MAKRLSLVFCCFAALASPTLVIATETVPYKCYAAIGWWNLGAQYKPAATDIVWAKVWLGQLTFSGGGGQSGPGVVHITQEQFAMDQSLEKKSLNQSTTMHYADACHNFDWEGWTHSDYEFAIRHGGSTVSPTVFPRADADGDEPHQISMSEGSCPAGGD